MRKARAATRADDAREIRKPDEQWRQELTPLQYSVLRRAHTERPFTGAYVHNHQDIEGLSTQEAADIAGVSQAAFKSRLHQARLRVRTAIGDETLLTTGG